MHGLHRGTAFATGDAEGIPGQLHTDCSGRIPRAFHRVEAGEEIAVEEVPGAKGMGEETERGGI